MTGDADAAVAPARAAEAAMWERGGREWGWLEDATAVRLGDLLLGVDVDRVTRHPGFQISADGNPLPIMAQLRAVAANAGWTDEGLVEWQLSPTTYLGGSRPVDLLATGPDRVVDVAEQDLGIQW